MWIMSGRLLGRCGSKDMPRSQFIGRFCSLPVLADGLSRMESRFTTLVPIIAHGICVIALGECSLTRWMLPHSDTSSIFCGAPNDARDETRCLPPADDASLALSPSEQQSSENFRQKSDPRENPSTGTTNKRLEPALLQPRCHIRSFLGDSMREIQVQRLWIYFARYSGVL